MVKIKETNVTNSSNVVVQIPKWVAEFWELKRGDKLDIIFEPGDDSAIIIKKGKDTHAKR